MRLLLSVDGGSNEERAPSVEGELRSLHAWLLGDSKARRFAEVCFAPDRATVSRPGQSPEAAAMGPLLELLQLTIGAGFDAASLGVAIAAWRGSRPAAPAVTIERPDGMKVTITGSSTEETQELVRLLESATPQD